MSEATKSSCPVEMASRLLKFRDFLRDSMGLSRFIMVNPMIIMSHHGSHGKSQRFYAILRQVDPAEYLRFVA